MDNSVEVKTVIETNGGMKGKERQPSSVLPSTIIASTDSKNVSCVDSDAGIHSIVGQMKSIHIGQHRPVAMTKESMRSGKQSHYKDTQSGHSFQDWHQRRNQSAKYCKPVNGATQLSKASNTNGFDRSQPRHTCIVPAAAEKGGLDKAKQPISTAVGIGSKPWSSNASKLVKRADCSENAILSSKLDKRTAGSQSHLKPSIEASSASYQVVAPPELQLFAPKSTQWRSKGSNPLANRNKAFIINVPRNEPVMVAEAKSAMAFAIQNAPNQQHPAKKSTLIKSVIQSDALVTDSIKRFLETIQDSSLMPVLSEPKGFVGMLMPHQQAGLGWLVDREKNGPCHGSILADDMGLGKTIQTIALILECKPPESFKGRHATLIISPLAVIDQWRDEISDKTTPESQRIVVFHGSDRGKLIQKFNDANVVITTYDVLSADYKKLTNEAHIIKTRSTLVAKAAHYLPTRHRLCLTGTPLQNSIEDLFSIFQFLKQDPYSNYEVFKQKILKPLKSHILKDREAAMAQVKLVLRGLLLRRTKNTLVDGKPVVTLVSRELKTRLLDFTSKERAFYDGLLNSIKKEAKDQQGNILIYILKLRQACNHFSLIGSTADDEPIPDSIPTLSDLSKFLTNLKLEPTETKLDSLESTTVSSTKCDEVVRILAENQKNSNVSKTIVFSQFTSMLNVIQNALDETDILYCRYDGGMKRKEREQTLFHFKSSEKINVMLISTKCEQAIGRVHRIGQRNPVHVVRLVMKDTIEEKVMEKQKQKLDMIEGTIGMANVSKDQSLTKQEWITMLFS
ncbi:hypothetical protein BDEG_20783 [Batrachochytrium dendrobatidis JEL423]|uniref:Helicase ATP-binding domain-containing protein n=1 Tax=Batrachochytrium dendrobatidis (strain JEL423) TaxID=403673 RepID=A0A177W980_BATDL|nr:hypothetical protein BDEG_20783 [Batrachochytrium dendrobatidis JEL423]